MAVNALTHDNALADATLAEAHASHGAVERLRLDAKRLIADTLDYADVQDFLKRLEDEAARNPGPRLAALIDELLSAEELKARVLVGERLRSRLLSAQQKLGFPWALQIAPEDLVLLDRSSRAYPIARTLMGFFALVTMLADAGLGLLSLEGLAQLPKLVPGFFVIGIAHAFIALLAAITFRTKGTFRVLGRLWLLGPLFTLVAVMTSRDASSSLALGMVCSLPSMIVAWFALGLAKHARD